MKKRTIQQSNEFHYLINKLGLDDNEKIALVKEYTNGREESSSQMHAGEMSALINKLRAAYKNTDDSMNTMRRKIIALLCDYNPDQFVRNEKPDMPNIYRFVRENKHLKGISLNDLSYSELQETVTILEKWKKSKIEKNRAKMKVIKEVRGDL